MSWRENLDWIRWSLAKSSGCPWRRKKKGEQDWRMMQLCTKWREDRSYHTAQVGPGDKGRKKIKKGID